MCEMVPVQEIKIAYKPAALAAAADKFAGCKIPS